MEDVLEVECAVPGTEVAAGVEAELAEQVLHAVGVGAAHGMSGGLEGVVVGQ